MPSSILAERRTLRLSTDIIVARVMELSDSEASGMVADLLDLIEVLRNRREWLYQLDRLVWDELRLVRSP